MRREFFILANVNETQRSSATLRFIHVSQNEKFAAHLGAFSSGNSITSRVLRRAPKLLIRPLAHCRAKWARPTSIERRFRCWSFSLQVISRLRTRQGGFPLAPLTPSQRTPMFLDFYCYRRNLRLQARLGQRCFWRFLRIFPLLDLDECGIILFRDEDEPRCAANFSFWLT